MSDHARLGPSSAYRWLNCTASALLVEQEGVFRESEAADEGTFAHEVLEAMLLQTDIPTSDKYNVEEMQDHLEPLIAYVRRVIV